MNSSLLVFGFDEVDEKVGRKQPGIKEILPRQQESLGSVRVIFRGERETAGPKRRDL